MRPFKIEFVKSQQMVRIVRCVNTLPNFFFDFSRKKTLRKKDPPYRDQKQFVLKSLKENSCVEGGIKILEK